MRGRQDESQRVRTRSSPRCITRALDEQNSELGAALFSNGLKVRLKRQKKLCLKWPKKLRKWESPIIHPTITVPNQWLMCCLDLGPCSRWKVMRMCERKARGGPLCDPCPLISVSLAVGSQRAWKQPDRGAPRHILDVLPQGRIYAVERVRN